MPDSVFTRRNLIAGGVGVTAGTAAALAGPSTAAAGIARLTADDLLAIYNLKAGYAYGSDALARGDEAEGRARYASVFTSDARITSPPVLDAVGPQQAADQVLAALAGATGAQHLVGTIEVVPRGRSGWPGRERADITAYVSATVVFPGQTAVVLATYHDVAVKTRDGWRLESSAATNLPT